MFDIGFWEVALIGVIALLVVGPERLPALARTVGLWVGRIRRYVAHVKQDIEREIHAEEMRELLNASSGELDDIKKVAKETASSVDELRRGIGDAARAAEQDGAPGGAPTGAATPSSPDPAPSRTIAHHAVDEDPFRSANVDVVKPAPSADDARVGTENVAGEHEDSIGPTGRT